jgi:hypothetical protein
LALVNKVIKLPIILKAGNLLISLVTISFSRKKVYSINSVATTGIISAIAVMLFQLKMN